VTCAYIAVQNIFLNLELHATQVEVVPVVETSQINLGTMSILLIIVDSIGSGEILVRLQQDVPAEIPTRIDGELALCTHHCAGSDQIAGRTSVFSTCLKGLRILLADAGNLHAVLAIVEALAPLGHAKESLFGVVIAFDRQIVSRRQSKIIGDPNSDTELGLVGNRREQEAALALHRRVGNLENRQIGDRHSEELEIGVLEA